MTLDRTSGTVPGTMKLRQRLGHGLLMPTPAVRRYLSRLSAAGEEFTRERSAASFQVSRQAAAIRLEKLLPVLVSGGSGGEVRGVTGLPSNLT
jgi:hypothetical protein